MSDSDDKSSKKSKKGPAYIAPIASPLAGKKLTKKLLKLTSKGIILTDRAITYFYP